MGHKSITGIILCLLTVGLVTTIQPRLIQQLQNASEVISIRGQPVDAAIFNYPFLPSLGENRLLSPDWIKNWLIKVESSNQDPSNPPTTDWIEPKFFDPPPAYDFPSPPDPEANHPELAISKPSGPRFADIDSSGVEAHYVVVDLLWILLCSGLVFIMQAGFMCLESGLTRSKNSINVAIKNLIDFGLSVGLFWAFGFALMFGLSYEGWIGHSDFFLSSDLDPFLASFFLFQAMFCGTATTIVSGAVAERVKFRGYLIISAVISGLIYPVFGHWTWNGANTGELIGWLGKLGFVDFAGSTVVHSTGGWVALAAVLIVGARTGRFPSNEPPEKIQGSNLPVSVLGALILWFGWFGFNGGSTLMLNEQVATIIVDTVLAGVAGMISGLAIGWIIRGIPDVELLINGSLAGLVAITASCHAVTVLSAVAIGAIGAVVAIAVDALLVKLRIDDAIGAIPVHLGAGIWGTLAVGLFGDLELLGTGLSRTEQLEVQLLGIFNCGLLAFGLAYLILLITDRFFPLRVSAAEELIGLNVSEHRAKTEILDLFRVMDSQAKTQDLSLRVPVEPFTEVGQIADRYNQVMDALEQAVTRTDAIVRTATDAIACFNQSNLEIISANPSAELIFQYPIEQLLGMLINEIVDFNSPSWGQSKKSPKYIRSVLAEIIAAGRSQELVGIRADGSQFPIEVAISKAKSSQGCFYTGTFRDISDRKQAEYSLKESEQKFRSVMEQAADAFIIHDETGRIVDVNQITCKSLGYTREELLNLSIADIEENFLSEKLQERWQEMINGLPITVEGVQQRKDGSTFPVEVRVGLLQAGNKTLILSLCRDITDRKLVESALLREKEKSERLLLNILPKTIAEQLKQEENTIAEGFDEATVLFADIVGFTKLAARVSPTQLVHLLNEIFSRFDLLAEKHGLEKIKTIGDAYMVVGGLPLPMENHAEAIALMALDMQDEINQFSLETGEHFSIRIGINTGPVVAGVIGLKKFIYDLWGDTVNIASRMESHGVPGAIQVTPATYEFLKDKFLFERRGVISVKGKGDMTTYLLIRPIDHHY